MLKAAVLIEDMVEDVEFLYPYYRFLEAGYEVDVISQSQKAVRGKKGGVFTADKAIEDVRSEDYDLVFVPGGYAPDKLRTNEHITDFVKQMDDSRKLVAAICHGPWVLISAGVCQGRKMTSFPSIKDDIVNAGGVHTANPVSVDANLITATDPSAMPEMFQAIMTALEKR
ncbi:MAG: type 1 glutamine amidotransferase domain-containing protein [Hydrogenovibrio sp.]|uniref:type 1 glutamine amidotransferase domain-containing protein n=1 Tax=Hydrogenovibrio sp. TaxID=2065821 RepID=UPI0028705347|nr:type 1 glutamine amidotransferase domain-containing protein [Hydrogenovibrio sp.]MDR9497657.1 type 1 glutamine amidotransferase domain-containing protein [Hydrogenovibrio sp.]